MPNIVKLKVGHFPKCCNFFEFTPCGNILIAAGQLQPIHIFNIGISFGSFSHIILSTNIV